MSVFFSDYILVSINICMTTHNKKEGAGVLFICPKTKRVCLSLRAPYKTHGMCWSLWGGMMENNETPKECLMREFEEEIGFIPEINKLYPFDIYESRDKHFKFYTFICVVQEEFTPNLNEENVGYCWINLGCWPKPMHQGAKKSLCNTRSHEKLKLILEQYA